MSKLSPGLLLLQFARTKLLLEIRSKKKKRLTVVLFARSAPTSVSQDIIESLQSSSEVRLSLFPPFEGHRHETTQDEKDRTGHPPRSVHTPNLTPPLQPTPSKKTDMRHVQYKQTDASRAQLVESQIQARVASELRKLQAEEDARLRSLTEKLAAESSPEQTRTSRHEVSQEIQQLEAKLQTRKLVKEVPESVETARSEVVRCLRENDRRPLDCWREVQAFKEEVRRLEKGWVERVIS